MLDFKKKIREIIECWNQDFPQSRIVTSMGRDGESVDFADYAASILRDAAEAQFSDGVEMDDELCLCCGFHYSEHKAWEGDPPNYRSAIICPGGQNTFLGSNKPTPHGEEECPRCLGKPVFSCICGGTGKASTVPKKELA